MAPELILLRRLATLLQLRVTRLDRYMADGDQFHKPRRGVCPLALCGRAAIEHPAWRHRIAALLAHR